MQNPIGELERLKSLKDSGAISETEFDTLKSQILSKINTFPNVETDFKNSDAADSLVSGSYETSNQTITILVAVLLPAIIIGTLVYFVFFRATVDDKFNELVRNGYVACYGAVSNGPGYNCDEIATFEKSSGQYVAKTTLQLNEEILNYNEEFNFDNGVFCYSMDEYKNTFNSLSGKNQYTVNLYKALNLYLVPYLLNTKYRKFEGFCGELVDYNIDESLNDVYIFNGSFGAAKSFTDHEFIPETQENYDIVLSKNDNKFTLGETIDTDDWKNLYLGMRVHLFHKINEDIKSGDSPLRKYYPAADFGSLMVGGGYGIDEALKACVPGSFAAQSNKNIEKLYVREFTGLDRVPNDVDVSIWSMIGLCIYGKMSN